MSATPRTDAKRKAIREDRGIYVFAELDHMADFARQLESEVTELLKTLTDLKAEYDDRASQWGDDYLWDKHEDKTVIQAVEARLLQYNSNAAASQCPPTP